METLNSLLDRLLSIKFEDPSIYSHLNQCPVTENVGLLQKQILPKLHHLITQNILKRNVAYVSMLPNRQLTEFYTKYARSLQTIDIQDASFLFNFIMYERQHWIYALLNHFQEIPRENIDRNVNNVIVLLKLVEASNSSSLNVEEIQDITTQALEVSYPDEFWEFYVQNMNNALHVVRFCKALKPELNSSESKMFTYMIRNTFLDTLSCFLQLEDSKHWDGIRDRLREPKEKDTFTAFVVVSMLLNSLILKKPKNTSLVEVGEYVQDMILQLQDANLQEEMMENIYSLIFYMSNNESACGAIEIAFILSTLEELLTKLDRTNGSPQMQKLHEQVSQGLWRFKVINNLHVCKDSSKMLHYMLAPSDSLVQLSLKQKDFQTARAIIETCHLNDSDLEFEVQTAEQFSKLSESLKDTPEVEVEQIIRECLPKFTSEKSAPRIRDVIEKYAHKCNYLKHFDVRNDEFMVTFDLALIETQYFGKILELSQQLFISDESIESNLVNFYRTVRKLESTSVAKNSAIHVLSSIDSLTEEPRGFNSLQDLYDDFQREITRNMAGKLNKTHACHEIAMRLIEALGDESENEYLKKVFKYLRSFSQIFYLDKDNSDVVAKGSDRSYFELLFLNRSELTGNLLFERQVNPAELENYFGRLKLDFLYHVVGNCFPTINLHVQPNIRHEDLYHDNMLYTPSAEIITYIQRSNWLLACILCKMYEVQGVSMDVSLMRLSNFVNFLKTPRIQTLKQIFANNEMITALQNCIDPQKIKGHFEKLIKQDLISINSSHNSSEISEDVDASDWDSFHSVIESIPENQIKDHCELNRWRNELLVYMIRDKVEEKCQKCIYFITDDALRYETILNNFKKWNAELAILIIKSELSRFNSVLEAEKLEKLHQWLRIIMISDQFGKYCEVQPWHKCYNVCRTEKSYALRVILDNNNIDLLLDYIDLFKLHKDLLAIIDANYIAKILDSNISLDKARSLLNSLSDDQAIELCNSLLQLVRKVDHFQFVIDNLKQRGIRTENLSKIRTSLKMLSALDDKEHSTFLPIIQEPITILEVLLMNTRLDELASVLGVLEFTTNGTEENCLSRNDVNLLLRQYAEKSLVFSVIINPNTSPDHSEASESKLLQSVDSISLKSNHSFIIPEKVPSKEEWVPNGEVSECMCCLQVTFSMFNRRHHCRRCGRVVCYSCSLKRMIVPNYGDILVRVCKDCFVQTEDGQMEKSEVNVVRMTVQENWMLNDDPQHNKIVREEFSYEHSPSISLCLSILKYHSKNGELTRFLLEQCELLLKIIQSTENSDSQEVDISLVIKMLKSLALAANLSGSGSAAVDRILSQADLLSLLSQRGFLHWYPKLGSSAGTWALRKLKDKLIECEEWNLALDVSTKAGLNNLGVFAAWGKNCLEAGSLVLAREKFQRCLEKNIQPEISNAMIHRSESSTSCDSINLSQSSLLSPKISVTSLDHRTMKDPPLLREIIAILERKTRALEDDLVESQRRKTFASKFSQKMTCSHPISIMNRVRNLDAIVSGKYTIQGTSSYGIGRKIDSVFYEECVYYLKKYGTSLSLLEFYVKHGNVNQALLQILESKYSGEVFIEFYMKCLKNGIVNVLQENMSKIDPSLDVWKEYLTQICYFLEKHNLLNSLYQLQLFMDDFVRASITCVRFYEENVKFFKDFASNNLYLVKSELHLNQALAQEQWVELAPAENSDSTTSYGEKTLSNPHLVMVMEPKDIAKHIKTIKLQITLVNFLIQCETVDNNVAELLNQLYVTSKSEVVENATLPTLFGSLLNKIILAALAIISGKKIAEGFAISTQIVHDFKIKPIKVYCLAAKQLGALKRHEAVLELIDCVKSAEPDNADTADIVDAVLSDAIAALIKADVNATSLETLTKLIKNRSIKISTYITMGQLKTAYFLAVKYKRIADIKRIQREAELLNLPGIKTLCQKYLRNNVQSSSMD